MAMRSHSVDEQHLSPIAVTALIASACSMAVAAAMITAFVIGRRVWRRQLPARNRATIFVQPSKTVPATVQAKLASHGTDKIVAQQHELTAPPILQVDSNC